MISGMKVITRLRQESTSWRQARSVDPYVQNIMKGLQIALKIVTEEHRLSQQKEHQMPRIPWDAKLVFWVRAAQNNFLIGNRKVGLQYLSKILARAKRV